MLRFKYRIYIILFLLIPAFSTGASGNNKAVNVSSVIHVKDNLLTVKVRDIPLRKVLMEIANQTSIKIVLYASAEEPFITNFSRLPMEKGLKKLLRDYDYVFTYGADNSKDGESEIRKVVILSNTGGSQHRRTEPMIVSAEEPSLEPLSEEPYNEDPDILEEHMPDPLKELETMTASTGGPSLEPLSIEQYEEDMDIRDEEMEFDILKDELQDEEAEVRLVAVEILGAIGGDKAIQVLEGALADEDEAVREMAAEGLRRLKEKG